MRGLHEDRMKARMAAIVAAASLAWASAPELATETYVEETLGNGLRVVLIPHHANPMVASAVVVGAGVVQESEIASGASHFLEHLLFNGTTTRSQRQLYDDVDRLGAYNNATTREDHTLFTLLIARELAERGLAIQTDMLFRSTIPEENFDKERKIVLEELARDRSDESYDAETAFRAWAYAGTPVARPILGTEASLGRISRAEVVAYYKARYVPSNMTLVVMGDFDAAAMSASVKRTFGAIPKAPRLPAATGTWPPAPHDNVVTAEAGGSSRLVAGFPVAVDPWDRTAAAIEVLLAAASDGDDAPLGRALAARGVKPLGVSFSLEPRVRPWTTVAAQVAVPDGTDPRLVLDAIADAVRQSGRDGAVRARIARVVAQARADAAIARDQIHYYVLLRSSSVLGSPRGFLDDPTRRLDELGPDDWNAASRALEKGLHDIRARFSGPGIASSSFRWSAPDPAPPLPPAPLRTGQLGNGLRYVVRASGDSDVFALHLITVPRAAAEPAGQDGITDLLHRVMLRGTVVRDEAALQDRLARIGARIKTVDDPSVPFDDYYTTSEFAWIRLEVPGEHWREAVGLVAEVVRFPALTPESRDASRREMKELDARSAVSPRAVATAKLDQSLGGGLPVTRPVLGTPATLDAISLEALGSYHAASAVGRRTIVSVVGSVSVEDVVRALESDFGGMPIGEAPPETASLPRVEPGAIDLTLRKPQAYLALGQVLEVAPGDRAPLTIAVAMLSDRLAFELRETQGLAYSVGAQVRPWGGRTRLDLTMGTRPDNVEAARKGLLDGARAFRSATPSEADVLRAIHTVRGAALMRRMTRISLAYEAGLEAMRGQEPGDERRFVDSLLSVRADDVRRVTSAYIDPERFFQVVVR